MPHFHLTSLTSALSKSWFHSSGLEFLSMKMETNNLKRLKIFHILYFIVRKVSILHVLFFPFKHHSMSTASHYLELAAIYLRSVLLKCRLAVPFPLMQITAICFL